MSSPKIGEKCFLSLDACTIQPIKDAKCHLCLNSLSQKAFAEIGKGLNKKYLCTHECFKKYYGVPSFTLDQSSKKAKKRLKFEIPISQIVHSNNKYIAKDLTESPKESR